MTIATRFPFAYKADITTAKGDFRDKVLIGTVDVDIPVLTDAECPVAITWRTDWAYRVPEGRFGDGRGERRYLRYADGQYYRPIGQKSDAPLTAVQLPGSDIKDHGKDYGGLLSGLYDRHEPGGEDRVTAVRQWQQGKFVRQPLENDILTRTKSDYLQRKAEAERIAERLIVVDGVVHIEVNEPKLAVGTAHFSQRDDMPAGVKKCPLIAVFWGEARFGARLPHFNARAMDAKADNFAVALSELDSLLEDYSEAGTPVLLDFDDLSIDADLCFDFDSEANKRWRAIGEVVSRFSDQASTMPEAQFMSWARLRAVANLREQDVTCDALDGIYDDFITLCSLIDTKDVDRQRLFATADTWNDAVISVDFSGRSNRPR